MGFTGVHLFVVDQCCQSALQQVSRHVSGNEQVATQAHLYSIEWAGNTQTQASPMSAVQLSLFSNKQGTKSLSVPKQVGQSTAQREAGPVQTVRQRSSRVSHQTDLRYLHFPQRARGTTWYTLRGAARPRASLL